MARGTRSTELTVAGRRPTDTARSETARSSHSPGAAPHFGSKRTSTIPRSTTSRSLSGAGGRTGAPSLAARVASITTSAATTDAAAIRHVREITHLTYA